MAVIKLTDKQEAVLVYANHHGKIDFYEASRMGANGATLNSLFKKGLLALREKDGLKDWTVTEAGKASIPAQYR